MDMPLVVLLAVAGFAAGIGFGVALGATQEAERPNWFCLVFAVMVLYFVTMFFATSRLGAVLKKSESASAATAKP